MSRKSLAGVLAVAAAAFGLWSTGAFSADSDGWETQPPAPSPSEARTMLAQLEVKTEDTGHHYKREKWMTGWETIHSNCDARELILAREATKVTVGDDCYPTSGEWPGIYTTRTFTRARDVQIDHIVALSEANRSHTRHWTNKEREAFAMDPENLWAVDGSANQSKGDRDPGPADNKRNWLPENTTVRCEYVSRWIAVKHKYRLSINWNERVGLLSTLNNHC